MNAMTPVPPLSPELLARFAAIVGDKYAITDQDALAPYLVEMRGLYHGQTPMVLKPGSVAEVSKVVALANETRTAIVAHGGNTGLVGAQMPYGHVVVSLGRLDKVREVDPASNTMTCEAGVVLANAQAAAAGADRLFPLSLGSEGSCTIGGNLSSNAGGVGALAYGIARDLVMGVEVVLADGRVLNGLNKLKKDNTGYDLKNLFVGSEGTLGIITAAVVKLFPRPRAVETAFIGIPSPAAALDLLNLFRSRTTATVTSFELIARIAIDFTIKYGNNVRNPLSSPHPWYVLMELSSQNAEGLRETLEDVLAAAAEKGLVEDATLSASGEQTTMFWRIREQLSDSQKPEGGSIKHDVSVPVADIPAFMEEASAAVVKLIPGARPVPFGHMGDGNIHFNITQPAGADKEAFLKRWYDVNDVVHEVVHKYHGSISAEHGVGVQKRDLLPKVKDPVALELMRTLKRTLDPNNVLNPGKMLKM